MSTGGDLEIRFGEADVMMKEEDKRLEVKRRGGGKGLLYVQRNPACEHRAG